LFRNVKGYDDFFQKQLRVEKDISKNNLKINKIVTDSIKYEFFVNEDDFERVEMLEAPYLGLFSHDKIMCYMFVFDYDNEESFREVLNLAIYIKQSEKTQLENDPNCVETVKCFVANKYPLFIPEIIKTHLEDLDLDVIRELDKKREQTLLNFYDTDLKAKEIKYEIDRIKYFDDKYRFINNRKTEDFLFFVNAKYNTGIYNMFEFIINKINSDDVLWKKEIPDTQDTKPIEEVWEEERSIFRFCCGARYKQRDNLKAGKLDNMDVPEHVRLDTDEYGDCDALVKHTCPMENMDETRKLDNKGKDCLII
jgi:hypothetical protein